MNYPTFAQYAKTESIENASLYAAAFGVAKTLIQLWTLRITNKGE